MTHQVMCDGCGNLIKELGCYELMGPGISGKWLQFHLDPECVALWAAQEIQKRHLKQQRDVLIERARPWWHRLFAYDWKRQQP